MHMLYNSDSFVVVQFTVPAPTASGTDAAASPQRGGFEIVDKAAGKEIYIEGLLAERFRQGVDDLVRQGDPGQEVLDDYIAGFAGMAQQPVVLH